MAEINSTPNSPLPTLTNARRLLAEAGLRPNKRLGQNFLVDGLVLSKIVRAAEVGPDDLIVEVGPGLGALTRALAERARSLLAVEIDPGLCSLLAQNLDDLKNVEILNQDILKTDLSGLGPFKLTANLPYYITTPIIFKILEAGLPVTQMVLMVQKEVADRILAAPGSKAYGLLTLSLQLYGRAERVAAVPPHCFFPRPEVHSAVIKIQISPKDVDKAHFKAITKAAFSNRRKTLLNNLAAAGHNKEAVRAALTSAGHPEDIRAEALSFDDFANLTSDLY